MGDGLNIGQTWTVNVPASTTRTVSPNLWQYSLFPNGTAPSVMYPCDGLTNLNDAQLMNFDYGVTSFADASANMYQMVMPMLKQWMAQQAEMYQKIMSNLHSNTNINVNNNNNNNNDSNIDGTKVIKESQIKDVLNRIANDPNNKDRFNKEITITNKDGKEEKTTLLRRLIDLSKQYQDDPTTAEISEENYKLLWDIAGKYAKTGELSTEDYGKLLEIAKNPGGPGAYKADDEGETEETNESAERTPKNIIERANAANGYESTANDFYEAMDGAGTDKKLLAEACEETNKDNVLEIITAYNEKNMLSGDGLTLSEKLFDECNAWGGGNRTGLFGGNAFGRDDAKPFMKVLTEKLIQRAQDFVDAKKAPNTDELQQAINNLRNAYANQKDAKVDDNGQNNLTKAFDDLYNKLYKAEEIAYKKFDEQVYMTNDDVNQGQQ